jgi:flagellar biosynthesis protein FlhG
MANLEAAGRERLSRAVWEVARGFDALIIDTGAGIGSNAVEFAALADKVLLVATPDPTSLRDAYAMAKVLHKRNGVERLEFIANQVQSEAEGAMLHSRIQSIIGQFLTLELNYLGAIPRDTTVRESVTAGEPYVLRAPQSAAARAVEGLARRLYPQTAMRELC